MPNIVKVHLAPPDIATPRCTLRPTAASQRSTSVSSVYGSTSGASDDVGPNASRCRYVSARSSRARLQAVYRASLHALSRQRDCYFAVSRDPDPHLPCAIPNYTLRRSGSLNGFTCSCYDPAERR
ncbi:hypothetical protein BAUCODRAFT_120536 [Baudoinia panamericana UAMH 10762]|uniref:Uncharacterized protein n=1 Tax=Baudoinia panamericana (strain UAMH 10762) TaxID=717646 RepID=M2LX38_BAUPA|nr:uncharacterized protein BAUCODRAFT_120536 [Baudoinia panamericana UAMH 10762]EMC99252.1 hypothetical protein BAUCODRAFT_120536 [Baudoinia panamericana UAMH 10762]